MKKVYKLLALCLLILPFKVSATNLSVNLSCPSSARAGQVVSCNITGNITSGSLNGLTAKFYYTSGLTFSSFTQGSGWSNYYSSASGFSIANVSGKTGSTTFGVLKVKIPNNAAVNSSYSVTINNLDGSDTSVNSVSASGRTSTIRVLSGNNNLASLKVSNASISFNPNVSVYSMTINSATAVITASLADSSAAFVSGFGSRTINLAYGTNAYYVKVKAANGDIKTYTLNITRPDGRSNENRLSSLKVSGSTLNFNSNTFEYSLNVKENVSEVNITASPLNNKASLVSGYGNRNVKLKYGNNVILVKVKAENGSVRIYTLNIFRNDGRDDNNYLKSLSIESYKIDFNKEKYEYTIKVPYELEKLNISLTLESAKAKYDIIGNSLKVGDNEVQIKVKAENEQVRTYKIKVKKLNKGELLPSADINSLVIEGYNIDFKPDKLNYSIEVKNNNPLKIKVELVNNESIYRIIGNKELKDMSEVTIVVISTDLETKEYVIHIVKNEVNILPIVLVSLLLIVSIIALYLYKKLVNRKKMEPKLHIKETIYTENKIKDEIEPIIKNRPVEKINIEEIEKLNEEKVNNEMIIKEKIINKEETNVTVNKSNVAFLDDDDKEHKNVSFLDD